jgi:hypothetical protein
MEELAKLGEDHSQPDILSAGALSLSAIQVEIQD